MVIKTWSLRIVLILFNIFLIIFIFEIVLRFYHYDPNDSDSEGWWKLRYHTTLKKSYRGIGFTENPDQFHPMLGWIPHPNLSINSDFGKLTFNSQGIRSSKEYTVYKNDKKRIITIGDSFTYGECVNNEETYSAYLEKISKDTEVLNFGVHGYGLDQMLLRLNEAVLYKPDIVIVGLFNADVFRISLSFREYQKPKFILKKGSLELINTPLTDPDIYSRTFHLLTSDLLSIIKDKYMKTLYAKEQKNQELNLASTIIQEMGKTNKKVGANCYLLYLPTYNEVKFNSSDPHPVYTIICQDNHVNCIDPTKNLHQYIKSVSRPETLFKCHYSKEIHEVIAEVLYDKIN